MRRWLLALVLLAAHCLPAAAFESEPAAAMVGGALNDFVRPGYVEFSRTAFWAEKTTIALCQNPSPDALGKARARFAAMAQAWSAIEIVRFGPVTERNRLERILYWPDRRSIGLKQVQEILATRDPSAVNLGTLVQKSVAVQGLGALEYLLFGTGSESLSGDGDPFRCAYARAVATNLLARAVDLNEAWLAEAPGSIAMLWLEPGPGNAAFRSPDEAVGEIFDMLVHGLEMVRDVRLNGFLGQEQADDRPKQAIYWRSASTIASVRANLSALRALFEASGIRARLAPDRAWIASSIAFECANADAALAAAQGPVGEVLADPRRRARLDYARLVTTSLSDLIGRQLTAEFGITAGFSSLDGD